MKSISRSQYIIPPPSFPPFVIRKYTANVMEQLIAWAKREHVARLRYCAKRGYVKEWIRLNGEYSPIRVLMEIRNFAKICGSFDSDQWRRLDRKSQDFAISAFQLWQLMSQVS